MMNLLIVDDERHIVRWIYEMLEDTLPELTLYSAYSAFEALDWMQRTRIDIVITDIRMPRMTGIELMNRIHQNWPDCRVIFLTGYSEFDYVYKAIHNPGVQYLLKTEEDEVIVGAVITAMEDIVRLRAMDEHRSTTVKDKLLLQKEFLGGLVQGLTAEGNLTEDFMKGYELQLTPTQPIVLLLGRLSEQTLDFEKHNERLMLLYHAMDRSLSFRFFVGQCPLPGEDILWVLQAQEPLEKWEQIVQLIMGHLDVIQSTVELHLGIQLTLFLREEPSFLNDIQDDISHIKQQWSQLTPMTGSILTSCSISVNAPENILHYAFTQSELQERLKCIPNMQAALDSGNRVLFFEHFDRILADIASITSMHDMAAMELYYAVAVLLLSQINKHQLNEKMAFQVSMGTLMNASVHKSWKVAVEYLTTTANKLLDLQVSEQKYRGDFVLRMVSEFIGAHLGEDLSLIRVAEHVHYNPSYLSRAFKRNMGINLNQYILEARMRRAQQLLKTTNESVSAIATAVGFESAQYFATVFKRHHGTTPQGYRDKN